MSEYYHDSQWIVAFVDCLTSAIEVFDVFKATDITERQARAMEVLPLLREFFSSAATISFDNDWRKIVDLAFEMSNRVIDHEINDIISTIEKGASGRDIQKYRLQEIQDFLVIIRDSLKSCLEAPTTANNESEIDGNEMERQVTALYRDLEELDHLPADDWGQLLEGGVQRDIESSLPRFKNGIIQTGIETLPEVISALTDQWAKNDESLSHIVYIDSLTDNLLRFHLFGMSPRRPFPLGGEFDCTGRVSQNDETANQLLTTINELDGVLGTAAGNGCLVALIDKDMIDRIDEISNQIAYVIAKELRLNIGVHYEIEGDDMEVEIDIDDNNKT